MSGSVKKKVAWALAAAALLATLLGGALWIAGNTSAGRALIERAVYRLTSGGVLLSGLGGSFPQDLSLERLELRDAQGTWLSAEQVTLRWRPIALLGHRIRVDHVHAVRLSMERTPVSSSATPSAPSIPDIDVKDASIDRLQLGAALAGTPATLSARGTVHLRSWNDLSAEADAQRIDGDGTYKLRLHFDPRTIDAALDAHEPASGPLENILKLPGLGALDARLRLRGPRNALQGDLNFDAGDVHGHAQGSVDLTDRSADFRYSLEAGATRPRSDLAWRRLALDGRWQGPWRAPQAEGRLDAGDLELPGGVRSSKIGATLSARGGSLQVRARLDGVEVPGPNPGLLRADPLDVDASIQLNDAAHVLRVSASHPLFKLEARGATAGERRLEFNVRLPDIAPFAALAAQDLHGAGSAHGVLAWPDSRMRFSLDAAVDLAARGAGWSSLFGDRATLNLSGALGDAALELDKATLAGGAVSLAAQGSGVRSAGAITGIAARWQLEIADLGSLSPQIAGKLHGSGTLSGAPAALGGEAQLSSSLSVRGSAPGLIEAHVQARGLPGEPSVTLQAHGMLDEAPLAIDAALERRAAGALRVTVREAQWKSAHLSGSLAGGAKAALESGHAELHVADLGDLQHLLGVNLRGTLDGRLDLGPGPGNATLRLDGRQLAAGAFAGDAQLRASGTRDALHLKFDAQTPDFRGAPATLSADALLNEGRRMLQVSHAQVQLQGQQLHLLAPVSVSFADGLAFDKLRLGAHHALLEADGRIMPELDLRASLRNLGPAVVNAFQPDLLTSGLIEAHAQLHGSLARPVGSIAIDAADLRFGDDAMLGLPPAAMHASAELHGDSAQVEGRYAAGALSVLKVSGTVPLDAAGEFDLGLKGRLDAGLANPLLEARGDQVEGDIEIDWTLRGTRDAPHFGGTLRLAKGNFRDYVHGVNVSDINALLEGSEGTLQIKEFSARADAGTITASGTIGLLQPGVPIDVEISATRAQPIATAILTANLDARLRISGTLRERIEVGGSIDVHRAMIGIASTLPPEVAVLDVRRRGRPVRRQKDRKLIVALDLVIRAPQEILVQGRGLDAELGGEMHLTGTTAAPVATGGFDLLRGSVSLAGNRLSFSSGRVGFDGAGLNNKIDPTLDFTAQTTVSDVTATLRVTGLADAPKFEFSSTPPLAQDEIIARLFFSGESASQLSAGQVAQIGAGLAVMSGVGGDGSLNPLTKLQKLLHLDRLSVGASTATTAGSTAASTAANQNINGATIAAGRYVAKGVYVEVKQSTTGSSQVQVDVDLTKKLKLQTRLGNGTAITQGVTPENDPGSSIGLSYQFEY